MYKHRAKGRRRYGNAVRGKLVKFLRLRKNRSGGESVSRPIKLQIYGKSLQSEMNIYVYLPERTEGKKKKEKQRTSP